MKKDKLEELNTLIKEINKEFEKEGTNTRIFYDYKVKEVSQCISCGKEMENRLGLCQECHAKPITIDSDKYNGKCPYCGSTNIRNWSFQITDRFLCVDCNRGYFVKKERKINDLGMKEMI